MSTLNENNNEVVVKEVTTEKEEKVNYPYAVVIKFRGEGKPYSFGSFQSDFYKEEWAVVETQQGLEIGQIQSDAMDVVKYKIHMPTKPVIRKATPKDMADYRNNMKAEEEAFKLCNKEIEDLKLDMHLLSAQYTLDRTKILFVYVADQRVDFRELLKRLGAVLHCRIELRQIGERDKAKIVGGMGMCGMECCCSRFKSHFDVISINMAKNQLLALNTEKLSGMCGKLKCCLKYEDDLYKELTDGLPKMGSQVEYEGEIYRITNMNVMSREAKLENRESVIFLSLEDLRTKAIPRKGVVVKPKPGEDPKKHVKKTVHNTLHEEPAKTTHVDYELQPTKPEVKKEVRSFGSKKKKVANTEPTNAPKKHAPNPNRNRSQKPKESKPTPPAKNVTVRTFGRKKKDGETK